MRNRDYKNFAPNCHYHVFNRGNGKQTIFLDEQDYHNFLKRLSLTLGITRVPLGNLGKKSRIQPLPDNSFSILSYCLMPNHFHFAIRQNSLISISKLMLKVCTSYSIYFNKKYNHVVHIFQDQFKAKLVTNDSQLLYLTAYIHNNPREPLNYSYSSFKEILDIHEQTICDKNLLLKNFDNNANKYKHFVLNFTDIEKINISDLLFEDEDD
jgi:putative transposase